MEEDSSHSGTELPQIPSFVDVETQNVRVISFLRSKRWTDPGCRKFEKVLKLWQPNLSIEEFEASYICVFIEYSKCPIHNRVFNPSCRNLVTGSNLFEVQRCIDCILPSLRMTPPYQSHPFYSTMSNPPHHFNPEDD